MAASTLRRVTSHGCEIPCIPTTHIDCPCTIKKGSTEYFRYPHKFHALLMRKDVSVSQFRRDQLQEIMLQCFESPFDCPKRLDGSRTAVRVEFVAQSRNIKDTLRKLSCSLSPSNSPNSPSPRNSLRTSYHSSRLGQ